MYFPILFPMLQRNFCSYPFQETAPSHEVKIPQPTQLAVVSTHLKIIGLLYLFNNSSHTAFSIFTDILARLTLRYFIQTTLKRIISSISNSLVIFFLLFTVCSISTFTVQPLYNLPVLTAAVLLTLLRSMHLIMLYL